MKHFIEKASFITMFTIVCFGGQNMLLAQTEAEIISRLRETYDQVALMKAEFKQTITTPFGEVLPENHGSLILKGDQYRVETGIQTFVTDGQTTWIYDAYEKQVLINDYVDDETTFSISNFLENFDSAYKVLHASSENFGGVKYHQLQLQSVDDEAFFEEVTLWLRDEDYIITRLKVLDLNDSVLEFNLDDIEINPNIEADPFTFTPPADAEIIDLRS